MLTTPEVGPAVRVPSRNTFEDPSGERFVYLEPHGERIIERVARPVYEWTGSGDTRMPKLGSDGYQVVKKLLAGTRNNPELYGRNGLQKRGYVSLQSRLLKGERFNAEPMTSLERGCYKIGVAKSMFGSEPAKNLLRKFVQEQFWGVSEVAGMHALELFGHLAMNGAVMFVTPTIEVGPGAGIDNIEGLWKTLTRYAPLVEAAKAGELDVQLI